MQTFNRKIWRMSDRKNTKHFEWPSTNYAYCTLYCSINKCMFEDMKRGHRKLCIRDEIFNEEPPPANSWRLIRERSKLHQLNYIACSLKIYTIVGATHSKSWPGPCLELARLDSIHSCGGPRLCYSCPPPLPLPLLSHTYYPPQEDKQQVLLYPERTWWPWNPLLFLLPLPK